jgi:hypothetical protein
VASGAPIYLGNRVTTGPKGQLQIILLDETVFTIGPRAAIVIDEFVYDPNTSKGKVVATVLKGAFRFVTGRVSKRNPRNMVVKFPGGSIGVRGTMVAGRVDGGAATVVLLGPGQNTDTGERVGSIVVTSKGTDGVSRSVEISRPGFATRIAAGAPPTEPARISPAQLSLINGGLQAAAAPPPPEAGEPNGGGDLTSGPGPVLGPGSPFGPGTDPLGDLPPPPPPPPLNFGPRTTFEQIRSIQSGIANFASQTVDLMGPGTTGFYTISYSYNFGTQTAVGNVSITTLTGFGSIGTGSFPLLANPFATGPGPEPIDIPVTGAVVVGLPGGTADLIYKFNNANNVIFKELDHQLTYTEGPNSASGGGLLIRP